MTFPWWFQPIVLGTFTYQYDDLGRNTVLDFPDGHRRLQIWDELGRLTSRCYEYATTAGSPGTAPTRCYTASYDPVGNPTLLTDPERSCTIAYDNLDRVTSVTCSDGSTETYSYNELGALAFNADTPLATQRPRLSGGGSASAGIPATHAGQPVTLDAVGKVTSLAGSGLTWNHTGQLTGTGVGTFGHDAFLRRVAHVTLPRPQAFLYEGANIVVAAHDEEDRIGIDRRWGFDGVDHPLWMYDRDQEVIIWYEVDTIGNVRRLRGGPAVPGFAGRPTDIGGYKYTVFGKLLPPDAGTPTAAIAQPLRWQGRWYVDAAGGIYDFRNRWWSPGIGAFLSPDELDLVSKTGTLWSWPGQNPFRNADPFGLDGDPRAPLVSFLELLGFGDTAAVIVGHQNALGAIVAGNVDAAECEARGINAAAASLAVAAVVMAAAHIKINLLRSRAGTAALARAHSSVPPPTAGPRVLQSSGNTISKSTANALGLTKAQARDAMHKLKPFVGADPKKVGKIMSNGDYVDRETGEILGNLFDFID